MMIAIIQVAEAGLHLHLVDDVGIVVVQPLADLVVLGVAGICGDVDLFGPYQ